MYRKGDFKAADSLIKESKIDFDINFRYIFKDLNLITSDLRGKKLDSLLRWCKSDNIRRELSKANSNLYFEAIKLQVEYK